MKIMSMNEVKRRGVSILLITAARPEKEAVLKEMTPFSGSTDIITAVGKTQHYEVGMFGNYAVAHVCCTEQGSLREGAAILTIQEAVRDLDIKACVMVGIAYGADETKQKIGDVLISEKIQSYNIVRVSSGKNKEIIRENRNIVKIPGRIISTQFLNYDYDERDYGIHRGVILSGEELIDNKLYKEELLKRFSGDEMKGDYIVGGEMEGVALASVFSRYGNENWIVVKGICDWADGNKNDGKRERQEKAARNAVDFCKHIFSTEMLCQIDGIEIVKKKRDKEVVNGHVLFYYRSMHIKSMRQLSEETGIPEDRLREYEKVKLKNGGYSFIKEDSRNVEKLKDVLGIEKAISYDRTPKEMLTFYEKNYGKGRFYPIKNAKIVIFDFDGTLIKIENGCSVWQLIWLYLGYTLDDCARFQRKYKNRQLTHQEWCDITAECFKEKLLTSDDVESVSRKIKLVDGTVETLKILKDRGVKVYICSGAIKEMVETVLGEECQLFEEIVCNEFSYDKKGRLSHIKGTKYDFERKPEYIKKKIIENNIKPEECLFVGNSDNDIYAHKSGANTIVVNPQNTDGMDRGVWKYYLGEMKDLHELLPFIFPEDETP